MTSNIGSRQLKDFGQGVGFSTSAKQGSSADYAKGVIENALRKAFAPEFLNRIDDVVMFESLKREDIHKIIDIELANLYKRLHTMGFDIEVSIEAKDFLLEKGWDEQFGARPLKRAIQKYVEDALAEEIIKSKIADGDLIQIGYNQKKEELTIKIVKGKKLAKKENGKTGDILE